MVGSGRRIYRRGMRHRLLLAPVFACDVREGGLRAVVAASSLAYFPAVRTASDRFRTDPRSILHRSRSSSLSFDGFGARRPHSDEFLTISHSALSARRSIFPSWRIF